MALEILWLAVLASFLAGTLVESPVKCGLLTGAIYFASAAALILTGAAS